MPAGISDPGYNTCKDRPRIATNWVKRSWREIRLQNKKANNTQ